MRQIVERSMPWLPIMLLPAGLLLIFWWWSSQLAGPGFPLDDAWIHQTYARNFTEFGTWAFQAGEASAGSTSPLWTALLLPGYWLNVAPTWWSLILGYCTLLLMVVVARRWLVAVTGFDSWRLNLLALAVALEWHLVWAALSGMETLLAGAVVLFFFWLLVREASPWAVGAAIGVGVWVRPDLLSLAIPAVWFWFFSRRRDRLALGWLLRVGLAAASFFGPYLLLQWTLSGSPWPSTFYAKQAEYAMLRQQPWLTRFSQQWLAPAAGPIVLLLPAVAYWSWHRIRGRQWQSLAPILWVLVYIGTFASRLPVTYQHGRYAMPIIPVLLMLGVLGLEEFTRRPAVKLRLHWFVSRGWISATVTIALIFMGLGTSAYAQDVAVIQGEMVAMARWISVNTEVDALIAAHDIGALGYYGDRQIVDLAGLVSPEVIPILRDEGALAELLDERAVDYLMTFPEWYPQLVLDLPIVHRTSGEISPALGGSNMTLFRWLE